MNDTDLVESSDMRREKARRQAKKGVDALSVVEDFSNLPPDLQLTFKANSVILAELTIKSSELYKKQKIDVAKTDGAKLLEILLEAKKAK